MNNEGVAKTSPFKVAKTWGSAGILPERGLVLLEEHMAIFMDKNSDIVLLAIRRAQFQLGVSTIYERFKNS